MKKFFALICFLAANYFLVAQTVTNPSTKEQIQLQLQQFKMPSIWPKKNNQAHKTTVDSFQRSYAVAVSKYSTSAEEFYLSDTIYYKWHKDNGKEKEIIHHSIFPYPVMSHQLVIEGLENYETMLMEFLEFDTMPYVDNYTTIRFNGTKFDTVHYTGIQFNGEKLTKTNNTKFDSLLYFYNNNNQIIKTLGYNIDGLQIDSVVYNSSNQKIFHIRIFPSGEKYYNNITYMPNGKIATNQIIKMSSTNTFTYARMDSLFQPSLYRDSIVSKYATSSPTNYNLLFVFKKEYDLSNNLSKMTIHSPSIANDLILNYNYNTNTQLLSVRFESNDTFSYVFNYDPVNQLPTEKHIESKNATGGWDKSNYSKITYTDDKLISSFTSAQIYNSGLGIFVEGGDDRMVKVYFENHVPEDVSVNKIVKSNIKLYPNPTKDNLSISLGNEKIKQIRIIDELGRIRSSYNVPSQSLHTINISHLNTGIYILEIGSDKGIAQSKFIKE